MKAGWNTWEKVLVTKVKRDGGYTRAELVETERRNILSVQIKTCNLTEGEEEGEVWLIPLFLVGIILLEE